MGAIFELAKTFTDLSLDQMEELLESQYYEVRMGGVSIMDFQARRKKTPESQRKELFDLYIRRYYDPKLDLWRVVWLGATSGILVTLTAKPEGDEIRVVCAEDGGILNRWTFSEITATSFRWRGMLSRDNGVSWWPEQEMFARRQPPFA